MNKPLEKEMSNFYSSSEPYMNQLKKHSLSDYGVYLNKILSTLSKGSSILDVGCGVGQVANFLQTNGYAVTGIDISPLFIKEGRKLGKAKLLEMDSTKLKFKDESFASVISAESLEHMPNPKKVLEEMDRVLKKKGLLVLRFPNKQSKFNNFITLLTKKPYFQIVQPNLDKNVFGEDEDLCYLASTSDVIVFLRKRGYKIVYTKPFFWPSALILARKP
ncbi:Ubiquinone/menaquinone biosynthesis C-methyltransferase UbiE [uncultured archaeon]|nr:Ubiquinone/menaquinone biosynthesis C-methyltransferase UbiE [uncultured archaeon]